jgi:hypothetical protein
MLDNLRFDPRLPWLANACHAARAPAGWCAARAPVPPLPEADEDIAFAPVSHLARWIASGALTSRG